MKSLISAYASYDDAAKTMQELRRAGYNESELLLINRDDIINNHLRVKSGSSIERVELMVMTALGITAGILAGKGMLVIPGAHILDYYGPFVGAAVGFMGGLLIGEVVALLTWFGITEANAIKYGRMLKESKFLVFVQGEKKEIENAEKIAHTGGLHLELS